MIYSDDGAERRRSVLIVEHDSYIALDIKHALTAAGFDALGPASTIEQALHLLDQQRPDAAVLSFIIGDEDVTPVARQLTALKVPFLLASGTDASVLRTYPDLDGVRNLDKPTDMAQLVEAVGLLSVANGAEVLRP